jgi:subtilisin family serine protease
MRLSRRLQIGIFGLLVAVAVLPTYSFAAPSRDRRATSIIAKLAPGTDVRLFARLNGLSVPESQIDSMPGLSAYRFKIEDGTTVSQKLVQLVGDTQVTYAEPNTDGQIPEARQRSSWVVGGSDGEYASQWAGENIRLPAAHTATTGTGIVVAVLDTGIDMEHPALRDRLMPGYDFVDEDSEPREEGEEGRDAAFGHGTHVAGLVALAAPGAKIMPLRTLQADGTGDIWTQVRAIRYAINNGADVINLSYSFEARSQLLDEVLGLVTCVAGGIQDCRQLTRPGAVVVAAAGNSGLRLREYPAGDQAPGILGVGANTSSNTLAPFSTYGAWVQLMAPGEHIMSTIPGGGYASWSGTSMSTPLAAGVVALVRAAYPALRPNEVISRIATTAAQTNSAVRRRLDAAAAVGALPVSK